jgi:hypothetical protein
MIKIINLKCKCGYERTIYTSNSIDQKEYRDCFICGGFLEEIK